MSTIYFYCDPIINLMYFRITMCIIVESKMQLITCSLGLIVFQLVLRVVAMYTLYNDI